MAPHPKDAPPLTSFKFPRRGTGSTDDHLPYATSLVLSNETALATFRRAATLPRSRYPIDLSPGPVALLPHLAKLKSAAHLLCMESFVASKDQESERAVEAILANVALGRSLTFEPVLITQLTRAAIDAIAFNSAGYAVN